MDKEIDAFLVRQLSALVGHNSSAFYWLHQYWDRPADPRTRDYFLVHPSLFSMSLMMIIYMLLVIVIIPAFMKNRKPFNLTKGVIAYDILMVSHSPTDDHI